MRRWLAAVAVFAGCGGEPVGAARMMLSTDGLAPGDVGSAVLLVLAGESPSCVGALARPTPLDDAALAVVAHALLAVDGTPKHLTTPADRLLLFYAEAFASTDGSGARVGRGCSEATLAAGKSTAVNVVLTAN